MSSQRDILKNLLLKEELEVLDNLKSKLLSQEQFTKEVSGVLAQAILRANKKDEKLLSALETPIKKGVVKALSTSKKSIIDALLPLMGQLIRKTVVNNIKQFVSDINRTIELGFSTKAIKWRWQAFKTDKSFAEIVFQKTIRYQVKELFLISRENGLLIEHAGREDALKDNNAISAMLTVIQDFIRDSFNEDDANLENVVIKGNEYIFASGPKAYLVFIVKGVPTQRLKEKTQELIENVHAEFSEVLNREDLYGENSNLNEYLTQHLFTKNKESENKKINWLPWVALLAFIIASIMYWGYQNYQNQQDLKKLTHKAENIDGFFLQSVEETAEGFKVKGLKDPLANLSTINGSDVIFQTKPYVSLDSSIIKLRVARALNGYNSVTAKINQDRVTLLGEISEKDKQLLLNKINRIAGIESIDDKLVTEKELRVKKLLDPFKSKINNFDYKLENNNLSLYGEATQKIAKELKQQIQKSFFEIIINDEQLQTLDIITPLIKAINQTSINLPRFDSKQEKSKLEKVIKSLQLLQQQEGMITLTIIGESDCQGRPSDKLSQQRANKIKQILVQNNIDRLNINATIKPCSGFNKESNNNLLNVSFNVTQLKK